MRCGAGSFWHAPSPAGATRWSRTSMAERTGLSKSTRGRRSRVRIEPHCFGHERRGSRFMRYINYSRAARGGRAGGHRCRASDILGVTAITTTQATEFDVVGGTLRVRGGENPVADRWMIRGTEFVNCLCDWGCPCQFGAKSTYGHCEELMCGHIEEGYFNDTNLDGLDWTVLMSWPGEGAEGNGTQQAVIDDRADSTQREALRKIVHGESTAPGATHFFVYNSMMSTVLDTLYAPIELSIDVDQRLASLTIEGLVESRGTPIISPYTGKPARIRINMPEGIRYTYAEMGNGNTTARAGIALDFKDSYGQFNILHMNQDGVIR
ncbi:DUF1326 domain-containing protein [Nocardia sp. NPDC046763]|uniref:DUF1326 domain-containing protein n=1 Tax=Nocardia sp. NPDC046763 TaxID=3155256 RepID=UPI0033D6A91D